MGLTCTDEYRRIHRGPALGFEEVATSPADNPVKPVEQMTEEKKAKFFEDAANPPREASKLDPTLTDLLVRDLTSGQVRRLRQGSRRGTFGGGANPYDTPTLGG